MTKEFDINEAAQRYQNAKPFPNIVFENLVNEDILNEVVIEFPEIRKYKHVAYSNPLEIKDITSGQEAIKSSTKRLIDYFNSEEWISKLQVITGIKEKLIPDHKLMGGGLHSSPRNGLLKLHVDFNKHYETGYDRRVNLLLYLNKDWLPEYGGNIELWDSNENGVTERMVNESPTFNKMVIFNTTETSWHGLPDPIKCPEGMKRMSLALYYYSDGRPEHERTNKIHNSVWAARPNNETDNINELK